MKCCPYLVAGRCTAAKVHLRSKNADSLVVVLDRCCGVAPSSGTPLWMTCNFYLYTADCRYCRHYNNGFCKERGVRIRYPIGKCEAYDGPRPVPSVVGNVHP